MADPMKPQLGALPRPEGKLVASLAPIAAAALPVPPVEVHNIELVPDPDMLGNDVWGDCVFVSIENHRRIAAARLGVTIARLTAAQVIAKYRAFTGITTPPGPGAVVVDALNWVRKDSAGWGGNHLLYFADVPRSELGIRQAVAEFQSVVTAEKIRAAQEYPARIWNHTTSAVLGGHATAGGTYTALRDFLKSWGYIVEVTPSFFAADIGEVLVVVWDFMWESLTYDRQTALIADLQSLTGKVWTGPAPTNPPAPPAPLPEVTVQLLPQQFRVFNGLLTSAKTVQIAGVGPIPATATGVVLALRAVSPTARTTVWLNHAVSWDFGAGAETPNGWPTVALVNGAITFETSQPISQFVVDVLAVLTA